MSEKKQLRPRRSFRPEFKQQLVNLYRSGNRKCDIVREYDIANSLLGLLLTIYRVFARFFFCAS